jgi:hypothetical protein
MLGPAKKGLYIYGPLRLMYADHLYQVEATAMECEYPL